MLRSFVFCGNCLRWRWQMWMDARGVRFTFRAQPAEAELEGLAGLRAGLANQGNQILLSRSSIKTTCNWGARAAPLSNIRSKINIRQHRGAFSFAAVRWNIRNQSWQQRKDSDGFSPFQTKILTAYINNPTNLSGLFTWAFWALLHYKWFICLFRTLRDFYFALSTPPALRAHLCDPLS